MAEDQGKEEEEKFDFTPEGEAVGYISLDQARVLAMRHARENTDLYGRRYRNRELVWEVTSAGSEEDLPHQSDVPTCGKIPGRAGCRPHKHRQGG